MPSLLTTADLRADIRKLAKIDTRHSFLRAEEDGGVKEGWFDRSGLTILTERDKDGVPLIGVMLKYASPCPVDKAYDMQIKYWVANLKRPDDLDAAFKANIAAIYAEMVRVGATGVWGAVPKVADYLTVRLNPIATAAKCTKTDGATVEGRDRYDNFIFYFGNGATVNTYVQGIS